LRNGEGKCERVTESGREGGREGGRKRCGKIERE